MKTCGKPAFDWDYATRGCVVPRMGGAVSEVERVKIGDVLDELCARFGLEKQNCSAIHIMPDKIRFDVYRVNDEGKKYVDETGRVAKDRVSARVQT